MMEYKHILVGLDLTSESQEVAEKTLLMKHALEAKLSIVHVIEPLSIAYGGDIPMDISNIQEQIRKTAEKQLGEFSDYLNIEKSDQHLVFGRPETEIHALASAIDADLIIVGSHGRHGLALLLGSTANGVLHGAPCDVLAIRVGKNA